MYILFFAYLEALQQLRQTHLESICNGLEYAETRILLASFDLRQIAPIDSQQVGHLNLRPIALSPQSADPIPETYANISGHPQIIACRLLPMCWQLPTAPLGSSHDRRNGRRIR